MGQNGLVQAAILQCATDSGPGTQPWVEALEDSPSVAAAGGTGTWSRFHVLSGSSGTLRNVSLATSYAQ